MSNPAYSYSPLAREGWPFIALFLLLTVLAAAFAPWWLALPFLLLFLFSVQFFRDPARALPAPLSGGILCPADGRVIAIEAVEDPYLQRQALKISIFMNVFDVHVNRLPIGGIVRQRWYLPGKFFNAALDKASAENERNALWVRTEEQQDVTVVQVAGLVARRILCYVRPDEQVTTGQRFGFIRFGSRVDTYLPLTAVPLVHLGQRVRSGAEWIAQLEHSG